MTRDRAIGHVLAAVFPSLSVLNFRYANAGALRFCRLDGLFAFRSQLVSAGPQDYNTEMAFENVEIPGILFEEWIPIKWGSRFIFDSAQDLNAIGSISNEF